MPAILILTLIPVLAFAAVIDYYHRVVPVRLWLMWYVLAIPELVFAIHTAPLCWVAAVTLPGLATYLFARYGLWGMGDALASVAVLLATPTFESVAWFLIFLGFTYTGYQIVSKNRFKDKVPVVPFIACACAGMYVTTFLG